MTGNTTGAACAPCTEAKHSVLFGLTHELQEVVSRFEALNAKLGVYNAIPECEPMKTADSPTPDTLVGVIDQLPGMLNHKISKLHGMLNDLENSLI